MRRLVLLLAVIVGVVGAACGEGTPPSPTPTVRPPPTASPTPPVTPTPSPSPLPAPSSTPAPSPSSTPAPAPTPAVGFAEVIRKGNPERLAVTLSFDAGADAGFTAQILDTLKTNGIVASFGITGRWAEQNPEMLGRIVQEGHRLINHSYDHPSFTGLSTGQPPLSQAERWEQLDRTESIVAQLTGSSTKPYFRPPYGDYDASVNADVYARGYWYNVLWTVDSRGWQGMPVAEIVQRCLEMAQPGAIYILHVGSASQDAAALQDIIDGLRARGYAMVSLAEALSP